MEEIPTGRDLVEFLTVATAILTVVIAFAIAWIAWRQHILDANRLKLEMFDRRLDVYFSVLKQIREAIKKKGWPEKTDTNFVRQMEIARFLFPKCVFYYMDHLRKDLIEFASNAEEVADTPFEDPERKGFLKLRRDGIRRLRNEYPKVVDVFESHMSIKW